MDIVRGAFKHVNRTALISGGASYKYEELLRMAHGVSQNLSKAVERKKGSSALGSRVGILYPPGVEYVVSTWAVWMMGGIAVPLAPSYSRQEIAHAVLDSDASLVLSAESLRDRLSEAVGRGGPGVETLESKHMPLGSLEEFPKGKYPEEALIIYTSGTTGRPKGVLHTNGSLGAQIRSMTNAWDWTSNDKILHSLPLHHIHGIVNALYTAQFNGACVDMQAGFSPKQVWNQFQTNDLSLFMGVPTMYSHLISVYDAMSSDEQQCARQAAEQMRLFVCGSSACPAAIMRDWERITGHRLLERYGMTETGMILSNPLQGERAVGTVGTPLPGVTVKNTGLNMEGKSYELAIKSDSMFSGYWGQPEATKEAFDDDGWFRTGDIVCVDDTNKYYKILGRASVDIIKSGGYKLSALEIETAIMECPHVQECCVLGIPDDVYGEKVAAIVVYKDSPEQFDELYIQDFCRERLAKHKIPSEIWLTDSIPKNAMGKVNKKEMLKSFIQKLSEMEPLQSFGQG